MAEARLRAALEVLHEELGRGDSVSAENRALLESVASDLERVLEASRDADAGEHAGLTERLEQAAVDFESEHPQLAHTFSEIVAALARMGI